jgi:hypothetical protein
MVSCHCSAANGKIHYSGIEGFKVGVEREALGIECDDPAHGE